MVTSMRLLPSANHVQNSSRFLHLVLGRSLSGRQRPSFQSKWMIRGFSKRKVSQLPLGRYSSVFGSDPWFVAPGPRQHLVPAPDPVDLLPVCHRIRVIGAPSPGGQRGRGGPHQAGGEELRELWRGVLLHLNHGGNANQHHHHHHRRRHHRHHDQSYWQVERRSCFRDTTQVL